MKIQGAGAPGRCLDKSNSNIRLDRRLPNLSTGTYQGSVMNKLLRSYFPRVTERKFLPAGTLKWNDEWNEWIVYRIFRPGYFWSVYVKSTETTQSFAQ